MKEAAAGIGLLYQPVVNLKRPHYIEILEHTKRTRKLSGQGFNKYRSYLFILLEKLTIYDVLEYNPIEKIEKKKVIKVKAHRPPTKDQQVLIMNRIYNEHKNYYRFLSVLYGCTIRPKEICYLKIKDLHRIEQLFRLVPNGNNTKTSIERDAIIPDWLMDLLSEINLHTYNPEWYIFTMCDRKNPFFPGATRMHQNTPTEWWKSIVKNPVEKGGLGLQITQYSLKN